MGLFFFFFFARILFLVELQHIGAAGETALLHLWNKAVAT